MSPSTPLLWISRVLALVAAGISGYLFWVSSVEGRMPAGCGGGSGCASVLTSRWSTVLGISVSAPALVLYLAAFALLFVGGPSASAGTRRLVWSALVVLAGAIVASALWFVGVQVFDLKAYCPWCLTDHALGSILAVLVFVQAGRVLGSPAGPAELDEDDEEDEETPQAARGSRGRQLAIGVCLAGMGVSLAAVMIGLQFAIVPKGPPVKRLAADTNDDSGPGPERRIAVMQGGLPLAPHELPVLGSADAPKLLVVLFDYRCKYCRATHEYLSHALERYPGQFGVVLLPLPMEKSCNPHLDETEERFVGSCDVARLALAVWRTDRAAYGRFDAWLFEPEYPPDPGEARKFAESLVDPAALAQALADPWIDEQIRRHVKAYHDGGVDRIPVILSPGFAAIVGRPQDEEALFEVLERDLGLRPEGH